jgi:hypothetical protein
MAPVTDNYILSSTGLQWRVTGTEASNWQMCFLVLRSYGVNLLIHHAKHILISIIQNCLSI